MSVGQSMVASDLAPAKAWVANHLTGESRNGDVGVSRQPHTTGPKHMPRSQTPLSAKGLHAPNAWGAEVQ